ncbi:LANO_0E11892g1_1 [Lachancea nothofagi CBS 11611]|uniref:Inactive metallocarboxypeptidase ECM14 n=1 Tax=Lachancea nothofagi CBS 11611 TaxID=1266666 RepID=A0A1G4JXR5_9SACH|nr:LANO_0E11892g1_1 [Lachancea nothofagi CBS 11611]
MRGVFTFLVGVTATANALSDYSDQKVCRFHTKNVTEVKLKLQKYQDVSTDIWTRSSQFVDVRVPANIVAELEGCEVIIGDLKDTIAQTYPSAEAQSLEKHFEEVQQLLQTQDPFSVLKGRHDIFFDQFRDLDTIYTWLDLMELTFPELVKIELVGQTYEGRDMKALHISANNQALNPEKKTIIITGGVHAREWIGVSTACYFIYELLTGYGANKRETKYLNHLDFLIVPVFNPDGYVYTWSHDRLWRKNRQQTYYPRCFGIDIDHSFDFHWTGIQDFPCSEDYSGEAPFEALESESWNNYINESKSEYTIHGYLDLHSYSQEVLYPYAYSCDALPRDLENLLELSYGLAKAIRRKSGKNYKVLSSCEDRGSDLTPGLGSGSALDYMYHHRAHWGVQLKLRDTGNHGFLLPAKYINPVGKEAYGALKYFCDFILNPEL